MHSFRIVMVGFLTQTVENNIIARMKEAKMQGSNASLLSRVIMLSQAISSIPFKQRYMYLMYCIGEFV